MQLLFLFKIVIRTEKLMYYKTLLISFLLICFVFFSSSADKSVSSVHVSNLLPATTYRITVKAVYRDNVESESSEALITTSKLIIIIIITSFNTSPILPSISSCHGIIFNPLCIMAISRSGGQFYLDYPTTLAGFF